jgi:lambda family phage tail tape measure protein
MAMNMEAMLKITANVAGENNIRRLGNSMQGLEGRIKNASMATNLLYTGLKSLAAVAVTGGVVALAKSAIDLADDMRDLSQRTGVGVETLGQFKVAAELSGSSLEGVAKGLTFLNKNMVAAATGTEAAAAAFKTIGVSTTEADGTLRKADKVFLDVADRFAQLRDGPEKAALAIKIFGKAGAELIPILNLGSKEIQRFGLGIGPDFADKADAFNDQLGIMKAQTTVLTVQIGSALLPVMSGLVSIVTQAITFVGNLAGEFYKAIGGAAGLQQVAAGLIKTMVVLGGVTAGVFIATNITTFATALRGVLGVMRGMLVLERAMLAVQTARAAVLSLIAGLQTPGPAQAKAVGLVTGGAVGVGLAVGLSKLIDDLMKKIGTGISGALTMPNIPTPPPGTTPDLSGLRTGDGGKKKADDEAKRRRDALLDSANALKQSRAELQIEREMDPMRKIQLEYAEKRRVVIANADKALREALSGEQQANIQRTRSVDIQKLQVQETNALIEKFKELNGAGFEAAMSGELFYTSVTKTTSAMEDFRAGLGSYIESIGTLGANLSNVTQTAFKGLEDAIVSLTTTGTFNFQQFAQSIIEETTRMVTRMLIIAPLLRSLQSLFPGGGGGGLLGVANSLSKTVGFGVNAMGNVFAQNGIQKFARGGIVDKPTMFPFAKGIGLMGEAGPEAIMPLRRGRDGRLGVQATNGGGGVSVVVNVDAGGSNVQGNNNQAGQLGKAVGAAVQAELIKQRRPGGLLA